MASERLGANGVDDFRPHPFFEGIDWDNIFECKFIFSPLFSFLQENLFIKSNN